MPDGVAHLHLVHPRPVAWHSIFAAFARELDLQLVPWVEWLAKLEASAKEPEAAERNPAVMLLPFYRAGSSIAVKGKEAPGTMPLLSMDGALEASETLRILGAQDNAVQEDVKKWIAFWRKCGLLTV